MSKANPSGDDATWSPLDYAWDSCTMVAARQEQALEPVPAGGCRAAPRARGDVGARLPEPMSNGGRSEESARGSDGVPANSSGGGAAAKPPRGRQAACQADGCGADLAGLTYYHQRNKVCEAHVKVDSFLRDGQEVRFCQRCGHAHALDEFDAGKHSCRAQLEKHNARRRKRQGDAAQAAQTKPRPAPAGSRQRQSQEADDNLNLREGQIAVPHGSRRQSDRRKAAAVPSGQEEKEAGSAEQTGPGEAQLAAASLQDGTSTRTCSSPPLPLLDFAPGELLAANGSQHQAGEDELADSLSTWLTQQLAGVDDAGAPSANATRSASAAGVDGFGFAADDFELAAALMQPAPDPIDEVPMHQLHALPTAPQLTQQAMQATVSVKLFGCTPAELPEDLRAQLMSWFDGQVSAIEGYLRPGCTHLLLQATVDTEPTAVSAMPQPEVEAEPTAAKSGSACCGRKRRRALGPSQLGVAEDGDARAVKRVVAEMLSSGDPLWRTKTMLVQIGGRVALVHRGRLQQSWAVSGTLPERAVPAVVAVEPSVLLSGVPAAQFAVVGVNLMADACELVARMHGAYMLLEQAQCADCTCRAPVKACCAGEGAALPSAAWEQQCCGCCVAKLQELSLAGSSEGQPGELMQCCETQAAAPQDAKLQTVRLQLQQPLRPGLLHVDVHKAAFMAAQGGRVLVVESPAIQVELLAHAHRFPAEVPTWVDALGIVYEWVGDKDKVCYELVERTASRLLHWAVQFGMRATAHQLLSLLQSELMATAAALPSTRKLSALDGLALLSQADRACKAAQLHRVSRLGSKDELSLLHQAVRSQAPAMVEDVLAWGEDAGTPWHCNLAGPRGVTPLHLAALATNPATAAQLLLQLMSRCAPGFGAWRAALSGEGHSAAGFARRAGREELQALLNLSAGAAGQRQQPVALSCEAKAGTGASHPRLVEPSTPRRCRCQGECPCARSVEPCASCLSSDDDEGCCGSKSGTCSCCAPAHVDGSAKPLQPVRGCCGRTTR